MAHTIASFDGGLLRLIEYMQNNEVKAIIEKKKLYNVTDSSKNTLLHVAAQKNAEITRYLLASGSSVDAKNDLGETPLMLAIRSNSENSVELLLKAGANIHLQDDFGKSVLRSFGDLDFVSEELQKLLLEKLEILHANNREEIAQKLIDAHWPLQLVVKLQDSDLTRHVLQRGYAIKINDFGRSEYTALHLAVHSSDVENVKALLEYNANVNIKDKKKGRSPVWDIYDLKNDYPKKRLEILKMLLDRGAIIGGDPGDDYDAYGIFMYADGDAIKLLFECNVDRSADCDRLLVLHLLARNENPGTIEEIRGRGFDVNGRNWRHKTPLMVAASCGNTRAVEFLLNEGADIDAVDNKNCPAIFHAIAKNPKYEQCVQLLLERGANVQIEMAQDETKTIVELIWQDQLFSLGELVVANLAFQETRGKTITKTILAQINSRKRFKTHFKSSKEQLSMKVYESTTLSALLTVITDEKFEKYARNEEFVRKCQEAIDALSNYRYFRTILKRRLSKAYQIATLKTGAARVICTFMGINYDRCPLIGDNIIGWLDNKDMENLKNI